MKEKDRTMVTGLVALMLILWLGFLVHRAPRFAGSLWGGMLGITGASLMLVPLMYLIVKRVRPLKRAVTRLVSMRTLLAWHIYAGIVGPILGLLHTGHKFDSPLGISLTTLMLLVVVSGFVGRYLMTQISREIREKSDELSTARSTYESALSDIAVRTEEKAWALLFGGFWRRFVSAFFAPAPVPAPEISSAIRAVRLAESMADLEYAIKTHETFKTWFGRWLSFHIFISLMLYTLLGLHVWAAIYFGLRWFR